MGAIVHSSTNEFRSLGSSGPSKADQLGKPGH